MRFEKCIMTVNEMSEKIGSISLPTNAFEGVNVNGKFIAVKKKKSPIIRLVPIDPDSIVYEVYCEIVSGRLSHFIRGLKGAIPSTLNVSIIEEILDGTCEGGADLPCTFNGFVVIRGDQDAGVESFKRALTEMSENGSKIVIDINIEKLA